MRTLTLPVCPGGPGRDPKLVAKWNAHRLGWAIVQMGGDRCTLDFSGAPEQLDAFDDFTTELKAKGVAVEELKRATWKAAADKQASLDVLVSAL